jgi:CubicO group peptidase (beta-lactamase class C family)
MLLNQVSKLTFPGSIASGNAKKDYHLASPPAFGLRFLARAVATSQFLKGFDFEHSLETEFYAIPSRFAHSIQGASILVDTKAQLVKTNSASDADEQSCSEYDFRRSFRWNCGLGPPSEIALKIDRKMKTGNATTDDTGHPFHELVQKHDQHSPHLKTSFFAVVKEGEIVFEQSYKGSSRESYFELGSISKFIVALIVQRAMEIGIIGSSAKAALSAWSAPGDPRSHITIDNLLYMRSGLAPGHWPVAADPIYYGDQTISELLQATTVAARPATITQYSNLDALALVQALQEKLGCERFQTFVQDCLAEFLGMQNTLVEQSAAGDMLLSKGLWSTGGDLVELARRLTRGGAGRPGKRAINFDSSVWHKAEHPKNGGRHRFGPMVWCPGVDSGLTAETYLAAGYSWNFFLVLPELKIAVIRLSDRPLFELGARFDIEGIGREIMREIENLPKAAYAYKAL